MSNQYSQSRINRLEAIEKGEKKYISSTPCKSCGKYERYVSNKSCTSCTIKSGLEKLNNDELMKPYRTKEKTKKKVDKWREENPEKYQEQYKNSAAKQRSKKYYSDNKSILKNTYLQKNYGITIQDYNFLLEEQNKKCKICDNECPTGKSLAVDHNHETGKVRGLLCKNCNIGLGMFFDNIDFLKSAVLYLKSN
jgi:hypothetical protein